MRMYGLHGIGRILVRAREYIFYQINREYSWCCSWCLSSRSSTRIPQNLVAVGSTTVTVTPLQVALLCVGCALVGVVGVVCWWVGVLEGRLAVLQGGLVRVGGGVGDVYCGV